MNIVDEARRLTANGWKIFPLEPRSKNPLPGSNGWHGAKPDPTPWERNPDLNLGLPMAANGLIAFDIDGQFGKDSLTRLEAELGPLPTTRTHRRGNGCHLIFAVPDADQFKTFTIASNRDGNHEELRLIANGYLVAPPSIHPDGEFYDLADHPVVALPERWRRYLHQLRQQARQEREALRVAIPRDDRPGDDYNDHVTCEEILEQHGWTFWKQDQKGTHWTRPGKTRGTSAVVYRDNGKAHIYSSSAPIDADQQYDSFGLLARLDFNSDFGAATRHIATLGFGNPAQPMPPIEIAAAPPTVTPADTDDALRQLLIDWPKFWAKDHDDQQWLCDPIIPAGRSLAIYAPGGTGKSLVTLWIAACLATGRPLLNHTGPPIHVLYLDYEMTEADLMERLENMGFGPDTDWSHFHYALLPAIAPLDDPAGAAALVRLAQLVVAQLVVVDTFARAVAGDENEADTVRNFYRLTGQSLKAAGIAMIRIDHAGKDTTRGARGSSAKRDDVDIVWNLTALDGGTLQLKAEKRRVSWVPETLRLTQHGQDTDELHWRLAPESQRTYAAGTSEAAALLDELQVPLKGERNARKIVKEAGRKVANNVLRDAMRFRRERAEIDSARPEIVLDRRAARRTSAQ